MSFNSGQQSAMAAQRAAQQSAMAAQRASQQARNAAEQAQRRAQQSAMQNANGAWLSAQSVTRQQEQLARRRGRTPANPGPRRAVGAVLRLFGTMLMLVVLALVAYVGFSVWTAMSAGMG